MNNKIIFNIEQDIVKTINPVKLIYITPNTTQHLEKIARTSTDTECKENSEKFVRRLVKKGHLSVGRFAEAQFEIICSRCCGNQLVRHPHLSIVQESQRYVKYNSEYIIPDSIKEDNFLAFKDLLDHIDIFYKALIGQGIPKEDARYILPNACKTKILLSGNFQGWTDFCTLRNQPEAHEDIRDIAKEIFEILCKECPAFFEYFKGKDGYCKRKTWVDR